MRADLEPKGEWPSEWQNVLAAAHMKRGLILYDLGQHQEALDDYNTAIELSVALRADLEPKGEWPPEWQNVLAAAHMKRGVILYDLGQHQKALDDYDSYIELRTALRTDLEPKGEWPPEWQDNLVTAHSSRGLVLYDLGQHQEALDAQDTAIELLTALRADLESKGEWPPEWQYSLVTAHSSRGLVLYDLCQHQEALDAQDTAIELLTVLRADLEPKGKWPPEWQYNLSAAHRNRGLVLYDLGQHQKALDDYDSAIELLTVLRADLEPKGKWPPEWQYNLARAHRNRGDVLKDIFQHPRALDDYNTAIELSVALRADLEPKGEWPPEWQYNLATAHASRGSVLRDLCQHQEALDAYDTAIELLTILRADLEPKGKWSPKWQYYLATAQMQRGLALITSQQDYAAAMAALDEVITLEEKLREQLGTQWTHKQQKELATSYMIRGRILTNQQDHAAAMENYDHAIALLEKLRRQLGEHWPNEWQSDLARAYMIRGFALLNNQDYADSVSDLEGATALGERLCEMLGEHSVPRWQNNLINAYSHNGLALFASQQDYATALAAFDNAIALGNKLREQLGTQWPHELQHDLAAAYVRRGGALLEMQDYTRAVADSDVAITLGERVRVELGERWPLEWHATLATAYMTRGIALHYQQDHANSITSHDEAIALMERVRKALGERWPLEWQTISASAYTGRGFVRNSLIQRKAAMEDYAAAEIILQNTSDLLLPSQTGPFFALSANIAALLDLWEESDAWVETRCKELLARLDLSPVSGSTSIGIKLRREFANFHTHWLRYCIDKGKLEVIPQILNVMQGRHLTQALQDELLLLEGETGLPEEVEAYRKTLLEIREHQARTEAVLSGGKGDSSLPDGNRGPMILAPNHAPAYPVDLTQLEAEAAKLKVKLHQCRDRATGIDGYAYLKPPLWESSNAQALRERLQPQEAVLILFELRRLDPESNGEESESALIVYPDAGRPWKVIQMHRLGLLVEKTKTFTESQTRGYRRGVQEQKEPATNLSNLPDETEFWPGIEQEMTRALWDPLAKNNALENIEQLVVLLHGALHQLPITAGKPEDLDLVFYPGLPFFLERRDPVAKTPPEDDGSCLLHAFAGGRGDIPMTAAETALISGLWQEAREASPETLRARSSTPRILHLASHGKPDDRRPFRSWHDTDKLVHPTRLEIDHGENPWWGQPEIEASAATFTSVYLSACVGGQLTEDLDGTPSGLITKLFLHRKTRVAIAALVHIPDRWAAVLGFLFHQVLQREGLPPERALRRAVERLTHGEWFEDTADQIAAAFPPVLSNELVHTLKLDTLMSELRRKYRRQRLEAFLRLPDSRERQRLLDMLKATPSTDAEDRLSAWADEHGLSTKCGAALRKHLAPIIEAPAGTEDSRGSRAVSEHFLHKTLADEGVGRTARENLLSQWIPWEEQFFKEREDARDLPDDDWDRRIEELDRNDAEIWRERVPDIAQQIVTAQIIETRIPPQPHLGTLRYGMRAFGEG